MPPYNHIDARCVLGDANIRVIARVRQDNDLVHPIRRQTINLALNRVDRIGEHHVWPRACQFIRVLRCQTDQTKPLATPFDDGRLHDCVRKQRLTRNIGVRHQDREFDRIHKPAQNLGAIVEFVVAHGHRIIAHLVHHLGGQLALVIRIKQRALKLVSTVNQDGIVRACPRLSNRSHQPRRPAKAFAFGIVFL